ncbi:MAG TPA: TolC family protein [Candidatus Baltobacteraceae bacterium]|nr:TolC family protein [Candidatus Baltobacteraceae bacterium]
MNVRILSSLALGAMIAATPLAAASAKPRLPAAASIPTPVPTPITPPVPTVAPGYKAPDIPPTSANIVGVTQQPFVGISLEDAIGMALLKNPDLSVAAANTHVASYQVREAKGAYDVHFFVQPSVKHDTTAAENAFFSGGTDFQPIVQNYQTAQAGVQGQSPIGTQYNINLSQTKVNDNTFIDAFNPFYLASLNVSITQPLLKGLAMNDTKRQLELSVVNADATQASTLASVSTTISSVEDAYWDLLAAWRNVAIQEDALRQSVLQQQSNVRQAKQGAAAPIDAVESSTQVAIYQENVFTALQTVSQLQNQLKSMIVTDPGDPIWRANLVPTSPALQLPPPPTLQSLLDTAMKNRPEVRQAFDAQRQANVNLAYAKNQMLPQADLQLTYNGNGFAGNALPPLGGVFGTATPPPYYGGTFPQAYGNIGRFPTYSAGIQISYPIGNNTAKGALAVANEQERIAKIQSMSTAERIQYEVRNAVQNYQAALAQLFAARQARETAEQVLASEIRKYRNGESTTFLVDQRQITFVQNEGLELQAQTSLNKAVVELQRVDGSILSRNGVSLNTLGTGAITP